ncbi:MAG: MarR family transcriptional regulator, partial [Mariprofundaceae bacterium]|nr:MarR family transcriptional regulator [Mariprofundaceae bacterium]
FERCLYFNLNALTRRINQIWDDAFANMELSPAHAYLLRLVLEEPGLSPKQIGDVLKLKKSTVTRFIDGLEFKGFVVRSRGEEHDSRLIAIHPTSQARAIQNELEQQEDKLYQSLCITLGEERVKELVQLSKSTLDNL